MSWRSELKKAVEGAGDPLAVIEEARGFLHEISPQRAQPVDRVRWVPIEKVRGNEYNPNMVAAPEMTLLVRSIEADGYTQPCVTVEDGEGGYVVVDGFHARGRHTVEGMSALVIDMLDQGYDEAEVCNELGMEPEELLRLKYVTGYAKLFEDHEYQREWRSRRQVLLARDWEKEHGEETDI